MLTIAVSESAIFGLLGVIAGGGLTMLAEWLRIHRDERRRRRVAAHVLYQELMTLNGILDAVVKHQRTDTDLNVQKVASAWQQHRADLTDLGGWPVLAKTISLLDVDDHLPTPRGIAISDAEELRSDIEAATTTLKGAMKRKVAAQLP